MEISEIFDNQTMDAIIADAKASGISAGDVKKVLGTLTDQNLAPTRSANSPSELMSLLDDDQDAVVCDIADATGVERIKTSTILMLAAPFLLKYLFSSGSSQQSYGSGLSGALLSALLGGGQQQSSMGTMGSLLNLLGGMQPQQQAQPDLLSTLLGSSIQQTQQSNSLFGGLLGGQQPQQTYAPQTYNNDATAALLSTLLSGNQQQTPQTYVPQNNTGTGDLLSLFGGTQQTQQTQQSSQGSGLLNALFNLLGDNG